MLGLRIAGILLSCGSVCAKLGPKDPIVVGQTFMASAIDPTNGSVPWALTSHGVAEKLFTVDENGEIVGQVARSVRKVSDFVWEVTLKSGYMFSDGTVVDAQHVADCLMAQNKGNSNAQSSLGTMSVTALDQSTVRIQSERQTHVMDAVLAEWVFVVYFVDTNTGNHVFTGPYVIQTFMENQIDLIPNEYYPQADERPQKITIRKFADGQELAKAVKNYEVDIGFHLPVETLPEIRAAEGVHVRSFEVGYHYMMFYNVDNLQDLRVRRAIDLAIDRNALSQALAGGHGTRSLFPDNSPYFSDGSDPHGDESAAKALLEEAGWTLNNNRRRVKDGKELTVTLVAYPHRPGLVMVQPVIAKSLEALGITVTSIVTSQDWADTQKIINDRTFDLLLWAQHTLPAGDPGWFLNAFFRSDGGNNHANVKSATIDSHLDALSLAESHSDRILLSQAVQEAVLQEVPVSNLVTPFWHVGLSERMKEYKPWGSDYYVIRADLMAPKVPTEKSGTDQRGHSSMWMSLILAAVCLQLAR